MKETGFKCPNCKLDTLFDYKDGLVRVICRCVDPEFSRSEGEAIDAFYAMWPIENIQMKFEFDERRVDDLFK